MTQATERSVETFTDPHQALEMLAHRQAARGPQFVRARSIGMHTVWTISDWEHPDS